MKPNDFIIEVGEISHRLGDQAMFTWVGNDILVLGPQPLSCVVPNDVIAEGPNAETILLNQNIE